MEVLWESLGSVALVLSMVIAGFIFGKTGIMKPEHKSFITKFTVYLGLPCVGIESIFSNFTSESILNGGWAFFAPGICILVMLLVSYAVAKLFKISKERFGAFVVMCGFSNVIFMGIPLVRELFHGAGDSYAIVCYMFNNALFWSVAYFILLKTLKPEMLTTETGGKPKFSFKFLKSVISPPFITILICLTLTLLNFKPPQLVLKAAGYFSKCVGPLGLMHVGFIIAEYGFRQLKLSRDMLVMLAMRFIVAPVLAFLICRLLVVPKLPLEVYVVQMSMPVMASLAVVATELGGDEGFAAAGITLSTLAMIVVVPALMLILNVIA